ncbi:MAG: hypothetical protein IKS15_05190 [Opitutales bacterium]|nr:hypothetical protein [Opitutales bacterium]
MRSAARKSVEGGVEKFFEGGYAKSWFFKVGDAFMGQLDMASTLGGATQGTCFCFETGDVFYDSAAAYALEWGEAKNKIKYCARVLQAAPSSIVQEENSSGKKTKLVADGALKFALDTFENGEVSTREIDTNQFDFAEFLRTGELNGAGIKLC